jgi:N4-gp56 family major capsid protein
VPFGWSTGTTNFSNLTHKAIQDGVIATLRAGLAGLPKGAVVRGLLGPMRGETFTMVFADYPDLVASAVTASLTEGVPPAAKQLGIGTQDIAATQFGLVTSITDVAAFQSPHDLAAIAPEKVARTIADYADGVALTAIAATGINREYVNSVLSTTALMDAKAELQQRNIQPTQSGYYAILHPYALSGLEREASLNGYTDVQAQADAGKLSAGVVSQYRGFTFLPSSKIAGALSGTARTGPTGAFATDIWTLNGHGLSNGVRIQFSSLTGGANFSTATDYFVVNATTNTFQLSATRGGAVRDLQTSDVTASTFKSEVFPVYLLGKDSMGAGDTSTFEHYIVDTPDAGNPLNQFKSVGSKGIFGAAVLSFPETTDGAGANGAAVPRIYNLSVMSGLTA